MSEIDDFRLSKYHSSMNLVLFLNLFFKASLDATHRNSSSLKSSFHLSTVSYPSNKLFSSASSSSVKRNNKSSAPKNGHLRSQILLLIFIFNCFGRLEASRSDNLSVASLSSKNTFSTKIQVSLDSPIRRLFDSSHSSFLNLSSLLYSNENNDSSFNKKFLLPMSLANLNNTQNHVINQLSNRPSSNSSESFKQLNALGLNLFDNVKNLINTVQQIGRKVLEKNFLKYSNEIKNVTNSIIQNNGSIKTINEPRLDLPLYRFMEKDEFKLFFDDLPKFEYKLIDSNDVPKDDGLSGRNEKVSSSQTNVSNSQQNVANFSSLRQSIDEDYELLNIRDIEFEPQSILNHGPVPIKNPKELKLRFFLFNQTFELDLELNNQLLAPDFNVQVAIPDQERKVAKNLEYENLNCFYHGRLRTSPHSKKAANVSIAKQQKTFQKQSEISDDLLSRTIVSLSNCEGGLRGFIQADNYLYILNPLNEQVIKRHNLWNKKQLSNDTLLVKRTKNKDLINNLTKQITNQIKTKKVKSAHKSDLNRIHFDGRLDEQRSSYQKDKQVTKRTKRSTYGKIRLDYQNPTIELAVFGDESLYNYLKNTYFIKTDHQIITFILTILNGIQSLYNQFHKYDIDLKFNIVLLEIFEKQPKDLVPTDLQEKYLFRFCDWQAKRKYENTRSRFGRWDHSFLLTGLDLARYDKETKNKVDSVIGSALVGKMCTESSCSIGEGTLLATILVMAHEIAHSMDLSHDGDMEHSSGTNNCQNEKYIMTSSLGPGVYSFSQCSARELKDYLKKPNAKCLFVNNSKLRLKRKFLNEFHITNEDDVLGSWIGSNKLPGQAYSMDDQCKLVFGSDAFYAPTKYYSRCAAVTCRLNSTYEGIRYAHPTLEGTICGYEKWCRKGECVRSGLKEIDSKDGFNNEISSSNPYSIDLFNSNRHKKSNRTVSMTSKPKWKIFENNHDTTVNQRLLDNRPKINHTSLSLTIDMTEKLILDKQANDTKKFYINGYDMKSDSKIKLKKYTIKRSKINLTNLPSYWISLFDKKNNEFFLNQFNNKTDSRQGWSNWSNWSNCMSECMISDPKKQPVGFQISTRKCYSRICSGRRVRLQLCDASRICSDQQSRVRTLDQYMDVVCDTSAIEVNQSKPMKINGCFIKNCPNNELVSSHEPQLPNTSPCSMNDTSVAGANSYCFNGECRNFDCSGLSDAIDTKPCEDIKTTVGSVVDEEANTRNVWHPLSYCKQSCLLKSRGIQLAYRECNGTSECNSYERPLSFELSFQLCSTAEEDCLERELKSANEYANQICSKYKSRYPTLLSGKGKQLSPRKDNLHCSCIVSCEDLKLPNVYYEMNSIEDGHFPIGTNCTFDSSVDSYCINGHCVQFDDNQTPFDKKNVNSYSNILKQFPREIMHRNRH